ncbi:shikimate kinase [bacterium]|nr:shikimate kinase [bacterium]
MGTGKSTIGKELARVLGRKFVDIDSELELKHGCSIEEMFAKHGEAWFRERERETCLEIATLGNRVVATGGGALLNPEVFEVFQETGLLLCLYAQRDCLLERLSRSDRRPLLNGGDIEEKVDRLLAQRQELYDKIRIHVDTSNLTPMETAKKIADLLNVRQKILDKLMDQYIDLC